MNLVNKHKKTIKIVAFLFVVALLVYYLLSNSQEIGRLKEVNTSEILLIIFGQLTILIANALILVQVVKNSTKEKLSFISSAKVTAYSAIVNFFGFLQGGLGVRAIFLKAKYGITLKKFFSYVALQYLVLLSISSFLVLTGFVMISGLFIECLLALLVVTCLIYLAARKGFVYPIMAKLKLNKLVSNPSNLGLFFIFCSIQLLGSTISYSAELTAIGANFTLGSLLMFVGTSQFSIVFAITPGAIGIREGMLIFVSKQMMISLDEIIISSLLDKLVFLITIAIVAPLAFFYKEKATSSQDILE